MTPPTPDLTALEQWAREQYDIDMIGRNRRDAILALCETVRAQQQQVEAGISREIAVGCEKDELRRMRDAAVARAEQAERERDALMVQVDQWRRMADREVTACVEMRADRDAARAEVAQLQQKLHEAEERAIGDDATFKRLISERTVADQQRDAALSEQWKLKAEVAQAREQLASSQQLLRDAYAEAAEAGTWVDVELPAMVRSLVQQAAQARAERDNAITNHALLSDDYRNLQQDLRLTRGVLEAAQHRLVAHGCSGKHDMDDCPMCAAKATIATLRAELQAAQVVPEALRQAVDDLFVNGIGEQAERLVLTSKDGRDLGGWAKGPILDRLMAATRTQAHPTPAQEGQ